MTSFAQHELNYWNSLKSNIISNGVLNWPGVLYVLATPIGLLACYSSIKLGLSAINDKSKFNISNLWIAIASALLFACKIPYMLKGKLLALTSFILNLIGWSIAIVIFLYALNKHKTYKNDATDPVTQKKIL